VLCWCGVGVVVLLLRYVLLCVVGVVVDVVVCC